jgi:hypothetical protein
LECEIDFRGGGKGGTVENVDERFRRGKGSEFPFESISSTIIFGRRFVIEDDGGAKLPFDVVNIEFGLLFRFCIGFFGKTGI